MLGRDGKTECVGRFLDLGEASFLRSTDIVLFLLLSRIGNFSFQGVDNNNYLVRFLASKLNMTNT